jgi:hypothetical protein
VLLLLPAGSFFGGTVLNFIRNRGQVVIVADSGAEVTVKEKGAVVAEVIGGRVISLGAGAHELEVAIKDAEGKARSFAMQFSLARGGTSVLDVHQELARLDDETERGVAQWVLGLGGRITVWVRDREKQVHSVKELPEEAFRVTRVNFYKNPQVNDAGLAHLEKLTHLSSVELFGTRISDAGLSRLRNLTTLSEVDVGQTQVGDAALEHLARLTNLTSLQLAQTRVGAAGLKHLEGLTRLSRLDLSKTRVSDAGLVGLSKLRHLLRLDLTGTLIGDAGLAHLARLTNLNGLWLRDTQVGDAGLKHLRALGYLESLDLSKTRVSDAGLPHLTALRYLSRLDLAQTRVSDAALTHLQALRKVDSLGLRGTRLSARATATLKKSFPRATITWSEPNRSAAEAVLALGGVVHVRAKGQADDCLVSSAANLPEESFRLTRVSLAHVQGLVGDLWPKLAALGDPDFDDLHVLDLSGRTLGDKDISALAALTTLTDLSLAQTPVSDADLERLKGLKKLRRLSLAGSGVTDKGLTHLHGLSEMQELDLNDTKTTAMGISALRKALPNCQVLSALALKGGPEDVISTASESDNSAWIQGRWRQGHTSPKR